jgi:hypothetical protein
MQTLLGQIGQSSAERHAVLTRGTVEKRAHGTVFFRADDGVHGNELWKTVP